MGYKDTTVTLDFADLVAEDEKCYVIIKNPKLQPLKNLIPGVVADPKDVAAMETATYTAIANLITEWRVWDPEDDSEDPPVMPLPATAETVAKLPLEIFTQISDEVTAALPLLSTPEPGSRPLT